MHHDLVTRGYLHQGSVVWFMYVSIPDICISIRAASCGLCQYPRHLYLHQGSVVWFMYVSIPDICISIRAASCGLCMSVSPTSVSPSGQRRVVYVCQYPRHLYLHQGSVVWFMYVSIPDICISIRAASCGLCMSVSPTSVSPSGQRRVVYVCQYPRHLYLHQGSVVWFMYVSIPDIAQEHPHTQPYRRKICELDKGFDENLVSKCSKSRTRP